MAGKRGLIIAIDGTVGAGKSSTARGVAAALRYRHLDTGAMYRAVAVAARNSAVPAEDGEALARLLDGLRLELEPDGGGGRVLLDGVDVSEEIRRPEVTRAVGAYADLPLVRRALVERQRAIGLEGGVVAEGRDAGSVIFPGADLKVLMTADLEERARRRHAELIKTGVSITLDMVKTDIRNRDQEDERRDYGARPDPNQTLELDTTGLSLREQIDRVVSWARERGA